MRGRGIVLQEARRVEHEGEEAAAGGAVAADAHERVAEDPRELFDLPVAEHALDRASEVHHPLGAEVGAVDLHLARRLVLEDLVLEEVCSVHREDALERRPRGEEQPAARGAADPPLDDQQPRRRVARVAARVVAAHHLARARQLPVRVGRPVRRRRPGGGGGGDRRRCGGRGLGRGGGGAAAAAAPPPSSHPPPAASVAARRCARRPHGSQRRAPRRRRRWRGRRRPARRRARRRRAAAAAPPS